MLKKVMPEDNYDPSDFELIITEIDKSLMQLPPRLHCLLLRKEQFCNRPLLLRKLEIERDSDLINMTQSDLDECCRDLQNILERMQPRVKSDESSLKVEQ